MVFVFIAGGCWRYFKPKAFDKALWKEMLRYCLPMIPASISFWIINASDMFFVQGMCEGYAGRSGNHWVGLLSAGYFLPRVCQRAVLLRGGHHHAVPAAHAGVQG